MAMALTTLITYNILLSCLIGNRLQYGEVSMLSYGAALEKFKILQNKCFGNEGIFG
jgi:hypothetical protein